MWWLLLSLGCGRTVDCSDPATPLVRAGDRILTCAEASVVPDFIEVLASRALGAGEERSVLAEVASGYASDPVATSHWLDQVRTAGRELEGLSGIRGAERRATLVWEAVSDEGVIGPSHPASHDAQGRALAVWTRDDAEKLALAEMDIEGWIRYGSLCREVQGGGTLRISVADRVTVYRMVVDTFDGGDRAEQVGLTAIGPYWETIQDAWKLASYETQQAWIQHAPLPPPMTATSLAYQEAVLDRSPARHAAVLHEVLGPLPMRRHKRFAVAAP